MVLEEIFGISSDEAIVRAGIVLTAGWLAITTYCGITGARGLSKLYREISEREDEIPSSPVLYRNARNKN
jgi:hypothetical protein